MTAPDGDVTGNYTQVMTERGWTYDDLADDFARQAADRRALDGGSSMRGLERWARGQAAAAALRATAAGPEVRPEDAPPPQDPKREPPKRTAVPPPKRRG